MTENRKIIWPVAKKKNYGFALNYSIQPKNQFQISGFNIFLVLPAEK